MASGSMAMFMDSSRARVGTAFLDFTYSCQASAEHFEQCAEFLPLRNRGLGPLAVTVLPIPLARRATATDCAAVQSMFNPANRKSKRYSVHYTLPASWNHPHGLTRYAGTRPSADP